MKLNLIRIIKTCEEKDFQIHKEIGTLFDEVYVLDLSEEKNAKEYLRMTKQKIVEAEYKEKNKKITEILQKEDKDGWVLVVSQDEVFEKQTIEKIKKQLKNTKANVINLYEIEERKGLNIHTSKEKPKIFKTNKKIEYMGYGKVRIEGEYIKKETIREEYLKIENIEKLSFELKNLSLENVKKERAEILRRMDKEREAMVIYEDILKKTTDNDLRKEMMNELMIIYLENNQYKKIEELVDRYYIKEIYTKEFHYLLARYATKVETFEQAMKILNTINNQKENEQYTILENNKINNLYEKYEIAQNSLNEEYIIKTIIENIESNNDTIEMHVALNKLVLKVYGEEMFETNLKELYQTEEEKNKMYNVLNEMGLYKKYEKEIKQNIKRLENADIAKMYTSQFNEEGRKQAIEFSKIHSRKIHAVIYNLKNKNLEIQRNISSEKTLEMLYNFLDKNHYEIEKRKYKKHFYGKLLKEFIRIKNKQMEEKLLTIIDHFETATYKDVAEIYINEYEYEKAAYYLEKYTLMKREDIKEAKKLARIYKKINKKEDYTRLLMRIIKQEPYNKYLIEELMNTVEDQVITQQEKERIHNEIKKIIDQHEKRA